MTAVIDPAIRPQLQVLICTFGKDAMSQLSQRRYPVTDGVRYLISWQLPGFGGSDREVEEIFDALPSTLRRDDIDIYVNPGRGLSHNRNHALALATGETVLIGDDDVDYTREGFEAVIRAFRKNDADIITFRYRSASAPKHYPAGSFDLRHPAKGYYVSSIEIAFRLDAVRGKEWFSPSFGVGSGMFTAGEESLFVERLLRQGFRGIHIPETICSHDDETTTSRTSPRDTGKAKGALCVVTHPVSWPLRMIVNTLRDTRGKGWSAVSGYASGFISGACTVITEPSVIRGEAPWTADVRRIAPAAGDKETGDRCRFSIVIPVYNAIEYLESAVMSALSQTFTDFEIILADDRSTDSSYELIKDLERRYPDRIRSVRLAINSGACYLPRHKGAMMARGEYIVPLDADDYIPEDFLDILDRRLSSTHADLVYGETWMFSGGPDGKDARKVLPDEGIDMETVCPGRDRVVTTLGRWRIGTGGAYRRDLYLQGMRITDGFAGGAYSVEILTRVLLYLSERSALADARYYYRVNPESVTQSLSVRSFEVLEADRRMLPMIRTMFGDGSEEMRMMDVQNYLHVLESIIRLERDGETDPASDREIMKSIRQSYRLIAWRSLRGRTGWKYRLLMRSGPGMTRRVLRLLYQKKL